MPDEIEELLPVADGEPVATERVMDHRGHLEAVVDVGKSSSKHLQSASASSKRHRTPLPSGACVQCTEAEDTARSGGAWTVNNTCSA